MSDVALFLGDCLRYMKEIPDKSVDAIITDIPYGTTKCKWDVIIPLDKMWEQIRRICKGVFVTTASQPFTSVLVSSNLEWFKYEWVWDKHMTSNPAAAKIQPLRCHEEILVFSQNGHTYNPQKSGNAKKPFGKYTQTSSPHFPNPKSKSNHGVGYPKTILRDFPRPNNLSGGGLHPTQKSVALYEYLVRTYTNEGDTVLDFCMGSGTTGVACLKASRNFVGIEKEIKYFEIAQKRIEEARLEYA